jgi:hypothetical protein
MNHNARVRCLQQSQGFDKHLSIDRNLRHQPIGLSAWEVFLAYQDNRHKTYGQQDSKMGKGIQ